MLSLSPFVPVRERAAEFEGDADSSSLDLLLLQYTMADNRMAPPTTYNQTRLLVYQLPSARVFAAASAPAALVIASLLLLVAHFIHGAGSCCCCAELLVGFVVAFAEEGIVENNMGDCDCSFIAFNAARDCSFACCSSLQMINSTGNSFFEKSKTFHGQNTVGQ